MNRLSLAVLFAICVGVGAYLTIGNTARITPGIPEALAQDVSSADTSLVTEMAIGAEDAPITVIEYASFTCPHCANFHAQVYPELKANYIDTGKVRFINREVYFDRFGLWAGMVARCGETSERYFGIVDLIYAQQREWTQGDTPQAIVNNLRTLGKTAGLTEEMLDACMSDSDHAAALVKVFEETTKADDVRSTPTLVINGEKQSGLSYSELSALLDGLLPADG